ncbi:MAG: ATP synthase subunit I [Gammaproteobacteria bacterium]|nr:ATP synthase subunit I [Gammaproteobacteria bacterium]
MSAPDIADPGVLFIALLGGAALGALYLGTLWWTVRRVARARRRPVALLGLSLALRLAVVLAGFYAIAAGGHWERLLAALIGFVAIRMLLVRRLGARSVAPPPQPHTGAPP